MKDPKLASGGYEAHESRRHRTKGSFINRQGISPNKPGNGMGNGEGKRGQW
ncbi:hypothetical protein GCM10010912_34610 [Paenibacillus albidus]|uniref:Uncharacterized protein n=1 Tax=Paenibacillus albidus TaxID=2041023 RepID=A0A917CEY7_9BACL|nr:hypothetical protein GCM10010912_34610 [Paenibacillus albidus]